tara:strand:+ start:152 stop:373 length:222 start_codon:yes stop_codon:yes gene_type:complete
MVMEYRHGQIKDNIRENGKEVSTMEMVNLPGQIDENTSANSSTTKNMDMASITGQLASLTQECGKMENNTAKV